MRISDLLAGGDDGVPGEPEEPEVAADVVTRPVGSELLAADAVPELIEDAEIVEDADVGAAPAAAVAGPTDDLLPRRD